MNRRTALGLLAAAPSALAGPPLAFPPIPAPAGTLVCDPGALSRVATDLLRWMAANPGDPAVAAPTLAGPATPDEIRATLRRVASPEPLRLQDLSFRAWLPDRDAAAARGIQLGPDEIRLTKYLAWRMPGRRTRSPGFDAALYEVPSDEVALGATEAAARTDLLRLRYTRRQVLDGVFEPGGEAAGRARPLAWLPRAQVHEALLQGTVVVDFPDGTATLNVHRNNGMPWRAELAREPERQDRVWFFREVAGLQGYGSDDKVRLEPGAVVAGDIASLGLGGLFALCWGAGDAARIRLVLLADTGGAFHPNLFQLDWLVGTFARREDFDRAASAMPDRVRAFAVLC